jgi:hypothetical protein
VITKKAIKRSIVILLALIGGLYVLLLAGVWGLQDNILFGRRSSELSTNPSAKGWPFEDVWLDVAGGRTHGWWVPVENARGAVLYSHGSGVNIGHYIEDAVFFRELGLSVLLYDYGGYGLSTGKPSESRCCADARAMWDHLVQTRKIAPDKIVIAGSSLGGGVTADLAAHVSPAAVILESTFTTIPDTICDTYPFIPAQWLSHIYFRSIDKVGGIKCPVLISHSKQDTVVPFSHGQRLYERVNAPKMFVEIHGGHSGGKFESKDIYAPALKEFFAQHVHL